MQAKSTGKAVKLTQMLGRVSRGSHLDCVRESLRLASTEIGEKLPPAGRSEWRPVLWDLYVDSQTDYRAAVTPTSAQSSVESC